MRHMCNVNTSITSCKRLCYVGSLKSSFIIACGVEMKFNVCWNTLKLLDFDSTYVSNRLCFLIHQACCNCVHYVKSFVYN